MKVIIVAILALRFLIKLRFPANIPTPASDFKLERVISRLENDMQKTLMVASPPKFQFMFIGLRYDPGASWPGGQGGPWPTLEFRSSDFSDIQRFRRKITDFGLALSTFDQFRFFCIAFSSSHNICCFCCYFIIDIVQILVPFLAAEPRKNYEDLIR